MKGKHMGTCQHCGGSGSMICCGGGIEISHSYSECPSCEGIGRKTCVHCNGSEVQPK